MAPVIVSLRSKRQERAQLGQKLQHGTPAIVLLGAGLQALRGGPHGFELVLAVFEVAASVLLIVTMARAIRRATRAADAAHAPHGHHGVDWVDIFTGLVLFVEAAAHYHETHHVKRPVILLGAVLLTLGLMHGRIMTPGQRRRTLRIEDEGLYVGGKPFRSLRAKWSEIANIDVGERWGTITLKNGRVRKLDLPDLEGSHHVRAALAEAKLRLQPEVP